MNIQNSEGLEFLNTVENDSVDLILTDPPYLISKDTGFNKHYDTVKHNEENNIKFIKTEAEYLEFKKTLKKPKKELDKDEGKGWSKSNYLKYGTILGKKYCNKTQYGSWDEEFTMEELDSFISEYYKKLKKGGTLIIWFDVWKISDLKELMEKHKFSKIRLIIWDKTNPQPINQRTSYLSNCREIALLGVKGSKPTFNSSYDFGRYEYPMASGKYKFHPTAKNLDLFIDIIKKHSNEGDIVMDTFLGGGTTAIASKITNRQFIGCEVNEEYYNKMIGNFDNIVDEYNKTRKSKLENKKNKLKEQYEKKLLELNTELENL